MGRKSIVLKKIESQTNFTCLHILCVGVDFISGMCLGSFWGQRNNNK